LNSRTIASKEWWKRRSVEVKNGSKEEKSCDTMYLKAVKKLFVCPKVVRNRNVLIPIG
jgi:hypothetical protein